MAYSHNDNNNKILLTLVLDVPFLALLPFFGLTSLKESKFSTLKKKIVTIREFCIERSAFVATFKFLNNFKVLGGPLDT